MNLRRRLYLAILAVIGIVLAYAIILQWAMATFEGRSMTFFQALQVTIESLTTAGYGGFAPWESAAVNLLILWMNLSGVLLVFLAIPLFAVPLFRQVFETRPPEASSLTDHVVVCGYSRQDEVLRLELADVGIPTLFVDNDPAVVRSLVEENGLAAMVGDPEMIDVLRAANVSQARALVADIDDETNPTAILAARHVNPDLYIISVVRNHRIAEFHRYAGADEVVLARHQLGRSFARRASTSHAEMLREVVEVDTDLEITEILIGRGWNMQGKNLKEIALFDRLGITVIGAWLGGKFVVSPDPETTLTENTILLVAGRPDELEAGLLRSVPTYHHPSHVVVCGYGTVGWSVVEGLRGEVGEIDVVDIDAKEGVTTVGDVTDPATYESLAMESVQTVILAINQDTITIYATLLLNHYYPNVEIIARANDPDNVGKLYDAGADYVLSLPTVTGEILASMLIEEREIVTPQIEFEFIRSDPATLVGQSLGELHLRAETGATVVAVERDGELLIDLGPEFVVEDADVLIVGGSERAIQRYRSFIIEHPTGDHDRA